MTTVPSAGNGDGWGLPAARATGGRYLFFTNECVGLGHLRRSLALARAVRTADPTGSALIVTGSRAAPQEPPQGVDLVTLPAWGRDAQGTVAARSLDVPRERIAGLRAQVALATVAGFDPDVVVVDKLPLGLHAELRPVLRTLRAEGRCQVVLGLRDIEDDPVTVRRQWTAGGLQDAVRRYYDQVLVYGPESSLDALDCVGWTPSYPPVQHVGYVGTPLPASRPADLPGEYLLVTTGGGADGHAVAAAVLDAVRTRPLPLHLLVVAGPLMPADRVEDLEHRARGLDASVVVSRPDLDAVVAGARAAVTMAGYNTVSELLRAGTPALLVPRVRPSQEQLIRATRLAEQHLVDWAHPDRLAPGSLRRALDRLLARPRRPVGRAGWDGAARAAETLVAAARTARSPREEAS